ncbi:MAG TPA: magnesium chelatase subunit D family protein, partial [Steroidobacteraceae bacterium]|nr:magnesium chelatase subunit D family protein [Steroidobacteraceae bacterium]
GILMMQTAYDFPLAALVGQEQLKSALLLCAVNPGIGGVLIRGDKGSAKSTAARGLAGVMAPIERVVGCAYNCAPGEPAASCEVCSGVASSVETTAVPFVNLPLGASEDRVLGSLDFERALKDGRKAFQPGLLASAHRGILYIDEVNLLPDHLVDVLLDAAAMGINRVQREGLSVQHPARIALVGTMNQEEGELRPQLLDRFGMMVEVRAPQEPRLRTEIVRRRLAWEADPEGFSRRWESQQAALLEQVLRAQALLPKVTIAEGLLLLISELCCSQGVTSLRADLVMNKAARALAALEGRTSVEPDDLSQAAMLVLPHRRRAKPFEQPGLDEDALQRLMRQANVPEGDGDGGGDAGEGRDRDAGGQAGGGKRDATGESGDGGADHAADGQSAGGNRTSGGQAGPGDADDGESVEHVFAAGTAAPPPRIELRTGFVAGGVVGRRSVAAESRRGREVRAVPNARPTDLAVTATLHHSLMRTGGLSPAGRLEVTAEDLHQKVKAGRQGNLMLFVVDASGSMAALQRMEMVKATVLSLLRDAYERRDEVGVIGFRGTKAELLLSPTRSVDTAEKQLRDLPTGGRTPLAHALQVATDVLNRNSGASRPEPLLIVVSDGKANVALDGTGDAWQQSLEYAQAFGRKGVAALVLDTEVGFVRMGRAGELAAALGAQCLSLEEFSAETLTLTIRGQLQATSRRRTGGI